MRVAGKLPRPPLPINTGCAAPRGAPTPSWEVFSRGKNTLLMEQQDGGRWEKILGPFLSSWVVAFGFSIVNGVGVAHRSLLHCHSCVILSI